MHERKECKTKTSFSRAFGLYSEDRVEIWNMMATYWPLSRKQYIQKFPNLSRGVNRPNVLLMAKTHHSHQILHVFLLALFCLLMGCGSGLQSLSEVMPEEATSNQEVDNNEGAGSDTSLSSPAGDPSFAVLPDGRKLSSIRVSATPLFLAKGTGTTFTAAKQAEYLKLKTATQKEAAHQVQWVLMDLDTHRVIEKSLSSHRKIFGASSSKIYVAAALLDKQNGQLRDSQLQLMANMLVVSSNEAWVELQRQIGDGSADKGREWIQKFTQSMGYLNTKGFQGSWGKIHGNELIADESTETLYDIYNNAFPGAELQWKLMHTCRTGANRGRKYIPKSVYVGGKTGTYDGPTINPETGGTYTVHVRNHLMVFNVDGHQYGLAVLANSGSDESAALLAGGLLREHTSLD